MSTERHVRAIAIVEISLACIGALLALSDRTEAGGSLLIAVLQLAGGIMLLRFDGSGRWLLAVAAAATALRTAFIIARGGSVGLLLGFAVWAAILFYLFASRATQLFTTEYRTMLANHPDPPPSTATSGKLLPVLLILLTAVWAFFSDVSHVKR